MYVYVFVCVCVCVYMHACVHVVIIFVFFLQTDAAQPEMCHVDTSLIMQLFSPLVLSNWGLIEQTKNPCSSVTCENGFVFVFRQVKTIYL